ncbi:MAG: MltA domain-containing protein [Bacteriovoracaceae bacterium]|nr:MltA domain-containing protein [Bacteriovoracaceae bacterium]
MIKILLLIISTSVFSLPLVEKYNKKIEFKDDLDFKHMKLAIKRQLRSLKTYNKSFVFGGKAYTTQDQIKTLKKLDSLITHWQECIEITAKSSCTNLLSLSINRSFDIYKSIPRSDETGHKKGQARFTSYYSPKLYGSKVKTDVYKYPIYKKPHLKKHRSYTRGQIEFDGILEGKNSLLFYVKDNRYDIWLMHVEGGGVVETIEDGKKVLYNLSYDGTNGKPFSMLSTYMLKKGYLTTDRSVEAQRNYILANPEKEKEIISSSQNYVYFKISKSEPVGVKNIPLTQARSMATDKRLYKTYGLLSFVNIDGRIYHKKEDSKKIKLNRFFITQDTGGGIRGAARADLYQGYGRQAQYLANNMNALGWQYFLMLKK